MPSQEDGLRIIAEVPARGKDVAPVGRGQLPDDEAGDGRLAGATSYRREPLEKGRAGRIHPGERAGVAVPRAGASRD